MEKSYLDYVNIKQGTKSTPRFSSGGTQAFTAVPFAMSAYSVQTRFPNTNAFTDSWYYHPDDRSFEGIRLTHIACNWIGDYGHTVFMPQSGTPYLSEHSRWSGFRPGDTILRPDYLRVTPLRYRYTLELVPTARCACMRITWKQNSEQPRFAVIPFSGHSEIRVDAQSRRIYGYSKAKTNPSQMHENTACYFILELDSDFDMENTLITYADGHMEKGISGQGEKIGINAALHSRQIQVKIATSFISYEQAEQNMKQELDGKSFEDIRRDAAAEWNNYLSLVEPETENEEDKKTFYSCLCRLFMFPRRFYEIDKKGEEIHCQPNDGTVRKGKMFVDNGFWDTARTVYPFYSIVAPDIFRDTLEGFVNTYSDIGWLPKWPSPAEVGLMPGTYIDGVIADAAVKGIIDGDLLKTAFDGMKKHCEVEDSDKRYGRHGTSDYSKYGYLPYEKHRESTNHTLDYIYGDFCIGQTANVLGQTQTADFFYKRAQNYKGIFDKETGFMRAKDSNGEFKPNFDPARWGGEYTEGSAWQNSFAVYHDPTGLAALYGGDEVFLQKIDQLFETSPEYSVGEYHYEMHEVTEMAAVDFGQCALSNQPSFHIPYLYSALGQLQKTQHWVTRLWKDLFSYKEDGYPGDEDTGTMAGWYIFSALGFYPLCPGKAEYVLGLPMFKKITASLPNNKVLTVIKECDEFSNKIVFNGEILQSNIISHSQLMNGGTLIFK